MLETSEAMPLRSIMEIVGAITLGGCFDPRHRAMVEPARGKD
jgi:hypothetical protein